jgi:hypothetical protein
LATCSSAAETALFIEASVFSEVLGFGATFVAAGFVGCFCSFVRIGNAPSAGRDPEAEDILVDGFCDGISAGLRERFGCCGRSFLNFFPAGAEETR